MQSFHTTHTEKAGTIAGEKFVTNYCLLIKKDSSQENKSKHLSPSLRTWECRNIGIPFAGWGNMNIQKQGTGDLSFILFSLLRSSPSSFKKGVIMHVGQTTSIHR